MDVPEQPLVHIFVIVIESTILFVALTVHNTYFDPTVISKHLMPTSFLRIAVLKEIFILSPLTRAVPKTKLTVAEVYFPTSVLVIVARLTVIGTASRPLRATPVVIASTFLAVESADV